MLNRIPKGFVTVRHSAELMAETRHPDELARTSLGGEDQAALFYVEEGYSFSIYSHVPLVTGGPSAEGWLTEQQYDRLAERYRQRTEFRLSMVSAMLQLFYEEELQGHLLADDGRLIEVPAYCWAGVGVEPDLRTSAVSLTINCLSISGIALVAEVDLRAFLEGEGSTLRGNSTDTAPSGDARERVRPQRERALALIKVAFPSGAPARHSMKVVALVKKVLENYDVKTGSPRQRTVSFVLQAGGSQNRVSRISAMRAMRRCGKDLMPLYAHP